jgi:hypothetical protein
LAAVCLSGSARTGVTDFRSGRGLPCSDQFFLPRVLSHGSRQYRQYSLGTLRRRVIAHPSIARRRHRVDHRHHVVHLGRALSQNSKQRQKPRWVHYFRSPRSGFSAKSTSMVSSPRTSRSRAAHHASRTLPRNARSGRLGRQPVYLLVRPLATGGSLGLGPAAPAAKRVKLSSVVDVTAEAEINPFTPEVVRDMFEKYSVARGEPPAPDIEPTAEQLGAVEQLVDSGAPPYADFALFGPHGRRLLKKLTYTTTPSSRSSVRPRGSSTARHQRCGHRRRLVRNHRSPPGGVQHSSLRHIK